MKKTAIYNPKNTVIANCRPPQQYSSFISLQNQTRHSSLRFKTFLPHSAPANLIILDDIHIHVDSSTCPFAAEFLHSLDCLNLKQHVKVPTHTKGHTLNRVMITSAPIKSFKSTTWESQTARQYPWSSHHFPPTKSPHVINQSLQSSHVPSALKTTIITPHLKKSTLNPNILTHYRPISNLPFLSKSLEKTVSVKFMNIWNVINNTKNSGQASVQHTVQKLPLLVSNNLLLATDNSCPSLLIFLDLTAAFDTVDHNILLQRLHFTAGLSGPTLEWFRAYFNDRLDYCNTLLIGIPSKSLQNFNP
ncbi:uncharacterized protein LOC133646510 [Entelurus aequoreus]|uniref:uncharacterized protein LOC133646510 n=1 Tax=Entelurus aequoreus TaxID=161455 RepID=UPI002B1E32D9|nr:uncharacterized protein LOC133646510 [Entelurus aequoreus]